MAGLEGVARAGYQFAGAGDNVAGAARYMDNMVGNEAFLIKDASEGAKHALEGFPPTPAFWRHGDGQVRWGAFELRQQTVNEPVGGLTGALGGLMKGRRPTQAVTKDVPFFKELDGRPVPPPPPTKAQQVMETLKGLREKAKKLTTSAQRIGQEKHKALEKAAIEQQMANEFLSKARTFIENGDKDSAKTALYEVVSHTQAGERWNGIAGKQAAQQSALLDQVSQFKSGLARVETDTHILIAELDAAKVSNEVTKEMTGLGSEASSLKDDIDSIKGELADLKADTAAISSASTLLPAPTASPTTVSSRA
jgi:phage shock protein A